jgi:hypothetical protein
MSTPALHTVTWRPYKGRPACKHAVNAEQHTTAQVRAGQFTCVCGRTPPTVNNTKEGFQLLTDAFDCALCAKALADPESAEAKVKENALRAKEKQERLAAQAGMPVDDDASNTSSPARALRFSVPIGRGYKLAADAECWKIVNANGPQEVTVAYYQHLQTALLEGIVIAKLKESEAKSIQNVVEVLRNAGRWAARIAEEVKAEIRKMSNTNTKES